MGTIAIQGQFALSDLAKNRCMPDLVVVIAIARPLPAVDMVAFGSIPRYWVIWLIGSIRREPPHVIDVTGPEHISDLRGEPGSLPPDSVPKVWDPV